MNALDNRPEIAIHIGPIKRPCREAFALNQNPAAKNKHTTMAAPPMISTTSSRLTEPELLIIWLIRLTSISRPLTPATIAANRARFGKLY